jgi:hypothetical protein
MTSARAHACHLLLLRRADFCHDECKHHDSQHSSGCRGRLRSSRRRRGRRRTTRRSLVAWASPKDGIAREATLLAGGEWPSPCSGAALRQDDHGGATTTSSPPARLRVVAVAPFGLAGAAAAAAAASRRGGGGVGSDDLGGRACPLLLRSALPPPLPHGRRRDGFEKRQRPGARRLLAAPAGDP